MTIAEIVALFGTMAILAATPSASVALVVMRSITIGVSHGIAVGAGIVVGDLIFIGLVMLGLTAAAEAMGGAFIFVKYLGAGYLMWLGLSLLRAENGSPHNTEQATSQGGFLASFFAGLLLTLGDIKAIFFYLSLLPIFVDLSALRVVDALIVVAVTIVAVGGIKALYAIFAHRVVSSKIGNRSTELSKKVTGVGLIGAGGYLAVK